ncbi:MAG: transposase [Geobacter sp.]|nr:MAG: transposase [Geobacter sp.]
MTFNPEIHHRRSIRLRDYDYSTVGAYFVTLCTFNRGCYFDQFPRLREIVCNEWNNIPTRFPTVALDEYIIMPNHFHGIIVCMDITRGYPTNGHSLGKPGCLQADAPSLGDIIGAFKSLCVAAWLRAIKTDTINARGKFWQKNYYEHVIRNEDELNRIRKYIVDNPTQWEFDRENLKIGQQPQKIEKWMI